VMWENQFVLTGMELSQWRAEGGRTGRHPRQGGIQKVKL